MATTKSGTDMVKELTEGWQSNDIAEKYSRAETATRPYADIILQKASLVSKVSADDAHINAFDLGCGTGAVVAAIYEAVPREKWANVKVLGGDISESMLAYLRARGEKNGWPGISTAIVDGANIQLEKNQFTHVFANAIIFFLPDTVLKTCFELLRPGGFVGVTTWAALPWWAFVERAVANMSEPATLPSFDEVRGRMQRGNPWHESGFVKEQLEAVGFRDVEVVQKKNRTLCGTPEQWLETMTMPLNMIAMYWEEGKREQIVKDVKAEMRKIVVEEAGGEDGQMYMDMEGIVGVGWKN